MSGVLLAALVALPLVAGALLCLVAVGTAGVLRAAPWLAVGTAALTAAAAVAASAAATRPMLSWAFLPTVPGGEVRLLVDDLSGPVLVTVTVVALLVLLAAALDGEHRPTRFWGLMLLFLGSVTLTVTAATLPGLLLGWEIMGATSYALIGLRWRDPERVRGGQTAFLTTRAADLGLYLTGGAALAGGSGWSLERLPDATGPWVHLAAAGVLVAALGKAAQLPFSGWLSGAMQGPSPVSALLHSAAMVAMGGYLLLRTSPLLAATGWAGPAAAWAGALTTVALGAVAVAQTDLKQLLAASTAAQLGFVVLAAGLSATTAGTDQLIAHAATKAALFLAAGAWLTALGSKRLAVLRGAARRFPLLGGLATIGLLALAGAPPLALWASKGAVLAAAREDSTALWAVGLVGAALSAAYASTALRVLWSQAAPEPGGDEDPGTGTVPRALLLPIGVLGLGAVGLGALAVDDAGPGELVLGGILALGVLAVVLRRPAPAPSWAVHWLGLPRAGELLGAGTVRLADWSGRGDDALQHGVLGGVAGVRGLARGVAALDDAGVAGAVDRVAADTTRAAAGSTRLDDAGPGAAVRAVTRGARGLGVLARRPQTGLTHQYYVQVAVVLAAALLLVLVVR